MPSPGSALGWVKVIIDEKLYDEKFVEEWCVGFDDLRRRTDEYPLEVHDNHLRDKIS